MFSHKQELTLILSLYTSYVAGNTREFCAVSLRQYQLHIPTVQSCSPSLAATQSQLLPVHSKVEETIKGKLWLAPLCFILYLDRFVPVSSLLALLLCGLCCLCPGCGRSTCVYCGPRCGGRLVWGPFWPSPANGARRPLVTGLRCVEHRSRPYPSLPSSCGPMAHVPLPIMPRWEQVNGGGPTAASSVFLGEQCAIATRLSGSSNMAPALHHMGWLASLRVCLSVCVCACMWGCMVDASPNANACRLKNGSLSPPLSLLFGKVYSGLLVLAVLFFSSPQGQRAREMHLSSILDSTLLISSGGMEIIKLCVSLYEYLLICASKHSFI